MRNQNTYDLLIVGAGPAGLSAARTAARLGFKTVVVERLAGPGELAHPCTAVLVPAPDLATGKPLFGGLFFPQVDLWIPESLITVHDSAQHCFAPSGLEYQTVFAESAETAPAIVDKAGLLKLMVEQAGSAGAEFCFGTEVTGLLWGADGSVVGVQTSAGDMRAQIVMSAEGTSRELCEAAGLYADAPSQHILVLTQELEAPAVKDEQLGRIVTLGRHESLPGYGSVLMTAPGRATVSFTTLASQLDCATVETSARLMDGYMDDPRVRDLLSGARALSQSSHLVPIRSAPASVVTNGFMGIGDAVSPAGHLGIMPAIYLGRQAALIAAEALDDEDPSTLYLSAYDQLYRALILPALEAETKTTVALLKMSDDELDRLGELLNWLHLPISFLGYKHSVEWETVCSLARQFPLAASDRELLRRVIGEPEGAPELETIRPVVSVPSDAAVTLS